MKIIFRKSGEPGAIPYYWNRPDFPRGIRFSAFCLQPLRILRKFGIASTADNQTAARVSISAFIDDRDQQLKHILRRRRPFNKAWLARLKHLTYKLLGSIYRQKSLQGQNINLIHALIELDVPDHDIEVLEQVLKFLKGLGYIRIYTEPLIPMAIELFLHSRQKIEAEPHHRREDEDIGTFF